MLCVHTALQNKGICHEYWKCSLLHGNRCGDIRDKRASDRPELQNRPPELHKHSMEHPKPGQYEHDAERVWWHDLCIVANTLIRDSGVEAKEIAALGTVHSGLIVCR